MPGTYGPAKGEGRPPRSSEHNVAVVIRLVDLRACLTTAVVAGLLAGCATRSVDVKPASTDAAEFAGWSCARIYDEIDAVQYRAADVAWEVDQRAGRHIMALGLGLSVFWPALLAMQPDGVDAQTLAHLKGRFEALQSVASAQGCPPPVDELAPERRAAFPARPGERLVYEEQSGAREPLRGLALSIVALRRNEIDFTLEQDGQAGPWRQDLDGNVTEAPAGALRWQRLLRHPLALGDVLAGEFRISGDPAKEARVRGQVVAVGPQRIADRVFDAAVIELFGDVQVDGSSARMDGVMAVDRVGGLLLRLDLRSPQPAFRLQRRLVRVESPG